MPNLTSHVALALAISEELEVSIIQKHLGSYLLGSTSPDIRIITHQSREVTHYSHLDSSTIGDGVAKLFCQLLHLKSLSSRGSFPPYDNSEFS